MPIATSCVNERQERRAYVSAGPHWPLYSRPSGHVKAPSLTHALHQSSIVDGAIRSAPAGLLVHMATVLPEGMSPIALGAVTAPVLPSRIEPPSTYPALTQPTLRTMRPSGRPRRPAAPAKSACSPAPAEPQPPWLRLGSSGPYSIRPDSQINAHRCRGTCLRPLRRSGLPSQPCQGLCQ